MARTNSRARTASKKQDKDFKVQLELVNKAGDTVVIGWVNLADSFTKKAYGVPAKDMMFEDIVDADKLSALLSSGQLVVSEIIEEVAGGLDDFEV